MAGEPERVGFLIINVLEAAGHDSDDAVVWEPEFKQGYARGEPGGAGVRCRGPWDRRQQLQQRRRGRDSAVGGRLRPVSIRTASPCCGAVEIRGGPKTIKVRAPAGPALCSAATADATDQRRRGWGVLSGLRCPSALFPLPQKVTSTQNVEDNGITWVEQLSL